MDPENNLQPVVNTEYQWYANSNLQIYFQELTFKIYFVEIFTVVQLADSLHNG